MTQRSLICTALTGAFLINGLLFLLLPLLSQMTAQKTSATSHAAFTFNTLRHMPPPPPEETHMPAPPPQDLPPAPPALPTRSNPPPPPLPQMAAPQPQFETAVGNLKLGTLAFQNVGPPLTEFDISQVDNLPQAISRREPVYPYRARQQQINGVVILKFLVSAQGQVQQVSVVQAKPPGIFEDAAIQAVSSWQFKPGILDQVPVSTWMTVPIRFNIN